MICGLPPDAAANSSVPAVKSPSDALPTQTLPRAHLYLMRNSGMTRRNGALPEVAIRQRRFVAVKSIFGRDAEKWRRPYRDKNVS